MLIDTTPGSLIACGCTCFVSYRRDIYVAIYPSHVQPLLLFPFRYAICILYDWIVMSFPLKEPHVDPYKVFAVIRMRYLYREKFV